MLSRYRQRLQRYGAGVSACACLSRARSASITSSKLTSFLLQGVTGQQNQKPQHDFVHRGIAARNFERRFNLADFVEVKDAAFEDGLLQIDLVRELPEAMNARRIEIRSGKPPQDNKNKTIEHVRAAS